MKMAWMLAGGLFVFSGQAIAMDAVSTSEADGQWRWMGAAVVFEPAPIALDANEDVSDSESLASTVPIDYTSVFELQALDIEYVLAAVDRALHEQERWQDLRAMRYANRLYRQAYKEQNYGTVIAFIQALKTVEQQSLVPEDELQNEVSRVIENLENFYASQHGEIIAEHQELVAQCYAILESIAALLPDPQSQRVLDAMQEASDKINGLMDNLTPYAVDQCAQCLSALPDKVLRGNAKRSKRREVRCVVGKFMSLKVN